MSTSCEFTCREESSSQQLSYPSNKERTPPTTYAYTMEKVLSPIVTVPIAVAESFHHHPPSQAQPEKGNLQGAVLPQSMNLTLPPPPTPNCSFTTTSTTDSTTPCQTATPPVILTSHNRNIDSNYALALPSTGVQESTEAESIRAEEAGEAFREHRAALLTAVTDPLILANGLYSSRIISRETLNRVKLPTLTSAEKNVEILDAVEAQIKTNPSSFHTLLDILSDNSQLQIFVGQLRQSYGEFSISRNAEYVY